MNIQQTEVVIIGAGFAGLYMLYRLRQQGMDARVFEAGGDPGRLGDRLLRHVAGSDHVGADFRDFSQPDPRRGHVGRRVLTVGRLHDWHF